METVRTNKSLNFIFNVLTVIGFWMPSSFVGTWRAPFYKLFSLVMFSGTQITYLVSEGMDIYVNLGDLDKNTATACIAISITTNMIKATKIITGHEKILRIVNKFDETNFSCVSKANTEHLLKAMKRAELSGKLLLSLGVITNLLWAIFPLLDRSEMKLPLTAWYPWDRSVRSTFIMLYVYQVTSVAVLTFLNATQDGLICSIMFLMCGQLDVLYSNISSLGIDDQESGKQNTQIESAEILKLNKRVSEGEDVKLKLKQLVMHQKDIINCCKQFEGIFGGVVLIQFVGSCTVICVTAFQLSMMPFSGGFMSNLFFLFTMLFELFLFCYPGNELMIKSARISDAAYNSLWYNQDLAFRKMLILAMERSKHPIIITAGRILPLTLSTLTSVLRSSYSFYAVLRSMREV